jgi:predicted  nucleic acid-binding Zn-ribbon protein
MLSQGGAVKEELAILCTVQELDTEIAKRKQALGVLDSGAALEEEISALRSELADLRQQREAAEAENLDLELEGRTLQEKRKRFNDQLYSGKVGNPRQLSDLQGEVEMLGREIRKVEDRMLELMETMESQRTEVASRAARLKEMEERLADTRARYEEASSGLRSEAAEMEAQRKQTAGNVSPVVLKRYEQIRARSGNLGLVKVMGTDCPGCRISLPSETLKHMKVGRSGLTCENCGRLLVWGGPEQ